MIYFEVNYCILINEYKYATKSRSECLLYAIKYDMSSCIRLVHYVLCVGESNGITLPLGRNYAHTNSDFVIENLEN